MKGRERLARWPGIGNNSRGSDMRRQDKMQEDMTEPGAGPVGASAG
jgi:hypothetical protein